MEPIEIRPWRECSFKEGHSYRVRRDFVAFRDSFKAGPVLKVARLAHS